MRRTSLHLILWLNLPASTDSDLLQKRKGDAIDGGEFGSFLVAG